MIYSQTVKARAAHGSRGYDGAKKIVGRKLHIAVDIGGHLLMVNVTTAEIADNTGAQMIVDAIHKRWGRAAVVWSQGKRCAGEMRGR